MLNYRPHWRDQRSRLYIAMYEIFDHTADLGLRIRAGELNDLFEEAARALFSVIVSDVGEIRPVEEKMLVIEAEDREELLRDWLAELLYIFHTKHMIFSQFTAEVGDTKVTGTARGEPIDPARHEIDAEIKAITYHGLKVQHDKNGWLAEVIVDV